MLQHMLGLESIGASLGDHTIQVQLGAAQDMGDYTLQPGVITTEPRFGLPFWYLQPKGDGPFSSRCFATRARQIRHGYVYWESAR